MKKSFLLGCFILFLPLLSNSGIVEIQYEGVITSVDVEYIEGPDTYFPYDTYADREWSVGDVFSSTYTITLDDTFLQSGSNWLEYSDSSEFTQWLVQSDYVGGRKPEVATNLDSFRVTNNGSSGDTIEVYDGRYDGDDLAFVSIFTTFTSSILDLVSADLLRDGVITVDDASKLAGSNGQFFNGYIMETIPRIGATFDVTSLVMSTSGVSVPEPGSWGLFLIGMICLFWRRIK